MAKLIIENAHQPRTALERILTQFGVQNWLRPGDRVFLKPNLTYPTHLPGVTTSPHFLHAVLACLSDLGAQITVGEGDGGYGSWPAEVAFTGHGLHELCATFGASLVNLSTTARQRVDLPFGKTIYPLELPAILLESTDHYITLPVPKVHAMTRYSGAVKNQWGCIPDAMRLTRHPDFPRLIWALNQRFAPRLVLADAQYMLDRNGPMWGDPIYMNRVIGGDDVLAFDVTVMKTLMGMEPATVPYLKLGRQFGHPWGAALVEDRSTGPRHRFHLRRTVRNHITAAAFPRQWAVNLLWDSAAGDLAHRVFYTLRGNPIAQQRALVERMDASGQGPAH